MKSSFIFIKKRGDRFLGLYFQSSEEHKNDLHVFSFVFEIAFADNYGEPVISHVTTARQIS